MSDKARIEAFKSVKRILNGAFSNLVLPSNLSGIDRAFAENIILGTIERKVTLEYVLSMMVQHEPKEDLKALLLTGIYQILYMDRVPDSAACDETVKIAKELFGTKDCGFVNGVLRNICRQKEEIVSKINNSEGYIKYSSDKELFEFLKEQYPEEIDKIFLAFFEKSSVSLRINNIKTSAKDVAEKVGGFVVDDKCVRVDNPSVAMKFIDQGEFIVQGQASQKAVELLNAQIGDIIIDVCACPGGKSLGAAIDMNNKGKIYSLDIHENKLPLITKSAKKLGIDIIETLKHDGRKANEAFFGIADKVICDVPCSGCGVMGNKPEIKYKSPESFKGLYPTQKAIIDASSKYLKVGGTMVYSTCSINKIENENVVCEFLKEHKNFKLISQKTYLPFEETNEGFFMAKIIREK